MLDTPVKPFELLGDGPNIGAPLTFPNESVDGLASNALPSFITLPMPFKALRSFPGVCAGLVVSGALFVAV